MVIDQATVLYMAIIIAQTLGIGKTLFNTSAIKKTVADVEKAQSQLLAMYHGIDKRVAVIETTMTIETKTTFRSSDD